MVLCNSLGGIGGEWEGGPRGRGMYMCMYIYVNTHIGSYKDSCSFTAEPTHYKAIILQFKKNEIWTFSNIIYKNKMDKDLNVRLDMINLLEEDMGRTLT